MQDTVSYFGVPIDKLIEALQKHTRFTPFVREGKWVARCPAHHGEPVELTIARDQRGRWCVACASGCELKKIEQIIELDLMENAPKPYPIVGPDGKVRPQPIAWRLKTEPLSTIPTEELRFLWKPYIPAGKVTLLEGNPGVGKSFLWNRLAAAVTSGGQLPDHDRMDGWQTPPGTVFILHSEDDPADTLRPRLESAGANLDRVIVARHLKEGLGASGRKKQFRLADLQLVRRDIEEIQPQLIVIDPIQAVLGGKVNSNAANEVRELLDPLSQLAQELDAAVLIVRHFRKSSADFAIHQGSGSVDFVGAARSVIQVGRHPDDAQDAVMVHVKQNNTPLGGSLRFQIENNAVTWLGLCDLTGEDLLRPPSNREEKSAIEEAEEFLRSELVGGQIPSAQILARAQRAGITERTLRRAKANLRVGKRLVVSSDGTKCWYFTPPEVDVSPPSAAGSLAASAQTTDDPGDMGVSARLPDGQKKETDYRCPKHGKQKLWRSKHGKVSCGICHPPASEGLVAEWLEGPDSED